MRWPILIVLTALLVGSAVAQPKMLPRAEDHLEPDASILGGGFIDPRNDMALQEAFGEMFVSDMAVRMIGAPAFAPEYAVGLRKTGPMNGTRYRAVSITLMKQMSAIQPVIIDKRGKLHAPPLPGKEGRTRCEVSIDDGLGDRIVEVWREMLMRTRYPQQYQAGLDGVGYLFSMDVRGLGPISGRVWSPDRNSSTGALVALANQVYDICTKKKDANVGNLEKLTAELQRRLK